jgi:hypothetical protein
MRLIKPPTPREFRGLALLCLAGALWSLYEFYRAVQVLPVLHGVGPFLQGYRTEEYSKYPFGVQELISFYGFNELAEHLPTPVFVLYLRIILHFLFWTVSCIIFGRYVSKCDFRNDAYRLVGTLAVGLVVIDEYVRLQVMGETYRHSYLANSLGTFDQKVGITIVCVILLLLLLPWYRVFHIIWYKRARHMNP